MIQASRRREERRTVAAAGFAVLSLALLAPAARADDGADSGRYTVVEENDYFFYPTDRHYTQGIRFSYLTGPVVDGDHSSDAFHWLDDNLFAGDGGGAVALDKHVDWSFGQSIFTPTNLVATKPDPRDRPYAGWAYLQAGLLQSATPKQANGDGALDDLELQIGVVGPMALADETQNDWHEYFMHEAVSQGWAYQLRNEPGLDLTYQRRWRFELAELPSIAPGAAIDFIPDAGAALGNVLTYGNAGGTLRVGYRLDADYGPPRIFPAPNGSDYFDDTFAGWGGYLFVSGEGRAVGRNIFLDGNTFQSSASVPKLPLVGDLVFGATAYWGRYLRATVSLDNRSPEFIGQQGPDRFTSLSLSANFDW